MDGLQVSRRVGVQSDSTYLLRSINFRESDVLVVFRVLHIDADDSVVIVWKMLKKFGKPDFVAAKPVEIG
jgi:hypothetical protein